MSDARLKLADEIAREIANKSPNDLAPLIRAVTLQAALAAIDAVIERAEAMLRERAQASHDYAFHAGAGALTDAADALATDQFLEGK